MQRRTSSAAAGTPHRPSWRSDGQPAPPWQPGQGDPRRRCFVEGGAGEGRRAGGVCQRRPAEVPRAIREKAVSVESHVEKLIQRNRSHRTSFLYEDRDWMVDAYVTRGLTLREMAAEAECGLRTIARWMQAHEIPRRTGPAAYRRGEEHHGWRSTNHHHRCPGCGSPLTYRPRLTATSCLSCRDRTGELNSNWRGDQIGVAQAHARVVQARGRADSYPCQHCDGEAREWAYDHQDPDEVPSSEGPYSLDVSRYMPLCVRCHRQFDLGRGRDHQ